MIPETERPVNGDDPLFQGNGNCLCAVARLQFFQDMVDMIPNRKLTDEKSLGNLFIRQPL
jgi:hypothetical protein